MKAADAASVPAKPDEVGLLVITVTSEYFVGEKPVIVRDMVNSIWLEHLSEYPAWAIRDAVSWWLGPSNKNRHRRPVPGDIAEICNSMMHVITGARNNAEYWRRYRGEYPLFLYPVERKSDAG